MLSPSFVLHKSSNPCNHHFIVSRWFVASSKKNRHAFCNKIFNWKYIEDGNTSGNMGMPTHLTDVPVSLALAYQAGAYLVDHPDPSCSYRKEASQALLSSKLPASVPKSKV